MHWYVIIGSPLPEFGIRARSCADYPEDCRVGRAWHGRAATCGRVALGSSRSSAGHTEAGIVVKIQLDITPKQLCTYTDMGIKK